MTEIDLQEKKDVNRKTTAWILLLVMLVGCLTAGRAEQAKNSAYEQYLQGGTLPSLKEQYKDCFLIGVAVPADLMGNEAAKKLIASQFSSLTCENEMKPDYTLSHSDTLRSKDPEHAVVFPSKCKKTLEFAKKNGIKVRAHTLIWHAQTPRWFFTKDWDSSERAELVDRETMIRWTGSMKSIRVLYMPGMW